MLLVDVEVCEIPTVVREVDPLKWRMRFSLVNHPTYLHNSITCRKDAHDKEWSIIETKAKHKANDLHKTFKRLVKLKTHTSLGYGTIYLAIWHYCNSVRNPSRLRISSMTLSSYLYPPSFPPKSFKMWESGESLDVWVHTTSHAPLLLQLEPILSLKTTHCITIAIAKWDSMDSQRH